MAVTTITTNSEKQQGLNDAGLMQLMQLTSPSLPIGGFSWSQGLEYAIDSGWLKNEEDTLDWLKGLLAHSLAHLDVPVLARLHQAALEKDIERFNYWNSYLLASRETQELYLEDTQMGQALKRLLLDLNIFSLDQFPATDFGYVSGFAMYAVHFKVDQRSACVGFLWSWLENQIAATLKIFPLGQTAGQRLFHQLTPYITDAVNTGSLLEDHEIGNSMPGQIMASMLHEEQYSRLFRS